MCHAVAASEARPRPHVTLASERGTLSEIPVCLLLNYRRTQPTRGPATTPVQTPTNDIVFACSSCSTSFVVDAAAAGMTLDCQKCGKPTTVPKATAESPAETAARLSDLQHQLKENESQRTEITSYINQLSIQLHRWQLRLQSLNERQQKLEAELAAAKGL